MNIFLKCLFLIFLITFIRSFDIETKLRNATEINKIIRRNIILQKENEKLERDRNSIDLHTKLSNYCMDNYRKHVNETIVMIRDYLEKKTDNSSIYLRVPLKYSMCIIVKLINASYDIEYEFSESMIIIYFDRPHGNEKLILKTFLDKKTGNYITACIKLDDNLSKFIEYFFIYLEWYKERENSYLLGEKFIDFFSGHSNIRYPDFKKIDYELLKK